MSNNTVTALKKLYKKMVGEDWPYEPNPTDAEVIDKIADDIPGMASVTYNLENVTSSNKATQAVIGSSYTTTLTVDPGYEIAMLYADMGGENVPMSDLTLDIPSVTGNIVITARADSSPGPIG